MIIDQKLLVPANVNNWLFCYKVSMNKRAAWDFQNEKEVKYKSRPDVTYVLVLFCDFIFVFLVMIGLVLLAKQEN